MHCRYNSKKKNTVLCLAVVLLLAGCAGFQEKPAVLQGGENRIEMKADNFSFDPNSIQTTSGQLEITLHNTSNTAHNITIVNPQGEVLLSRDIEPLAEEQIQVSLDQPGTYEFYCDKRFHPSLGMKGEIEVATR
jgi:plastocyanin